MSNKISGLCYDIAFGNATLKAVAVALADHASHDGSSVYPSVRLLAKKVECADRTVQRCLRTLESLGILAIVSKGGRGPRDTREWKFDVALMRDLADGHCKIRENKGDMESPNYEIVRVTPTTERVTPTTTKGDTGVTRTIKNHQEPVRTRARARDVDTPRAPSAKKTARAVDDRKLQALIVSLAPEGFSNAS